MDVAAAFAAYTERGESAGLEALIAGEADRAFSLAYRLCGDRTLAEEAVQESCIRLIRSAHRYRREVGFRAWWLQLVSEAARKQRRRQGRRAREGPLATEPAAPAPAAAAADDELEGLRRAVTQLPPRYRRTVELHYFAGLAQAAVASELGVAEGTVAARLSRARAVLRRRLGGRRAATGLAALASLAGAPLLVAGTGGRQAVTSALARSTAAGSAPAATLVPVFQKGLLLMAKHPFVTLALVATASVTPIAIHQQLAAAGAGREEAVAGVPGYALDMGRDHAVVEVQYLDHDGQRVLIGLRGSGRVTGVGDLLPSWSAWSIEPTPAERAQHYAIRNGMVLLTPVDDVRRAPWRIHDDDLARLTRSCGALQHLLTHLPMPLEDLCPQEDPGPGAHVTLIRSTLGRSAFTWSPGSAPEGLDEEALAVWRAVDRAYRRFLNDLEAVRLNAVARAIGSTDQHALYDLASQDLGGLRDPEHPIARARKMLLPYSNASLGERALADFTAGADAAAVILGRDVLLNLLRRQLVRFETVADPLWDLLVQTGEEPLVARRRQYAGMVIGMDGDGSLIPRVLDLATADDVAAEVRQTAAGALNRLIRRFPQEAIAAVGEAEAEADLPDGVREALAEARRLTIWTPPPRTERAPERGGDDRF